MFSAGAGQEASQQTMGARQRRVAKSVSEEMPCSELQKNIPEQTRLESRYAFIFQFYAQLGSLSSFNFDDLWL